jgi:hypothetical protein
MPFVTSSKPQVKHLRLSPLKVFERFRSSKAPVGGWTQERFLTANGSNLLTDLIRVQKLARRESYPKLTKGLLDLFNEEIDEFLSELEKPQTKARKPDLVVDLPDNIAKLVQAALQKTFSKQRVRARVVRRVRPAVQTAMDHTYRKSVVLLGGKPTDRNLNRLRASADKLCNKVTRISRTTKYRLRRELRTAMADNLTLAETVKRVRDRFHSIAAYRVPTIVRTEIGRAMDAATIQALRDQGNVTHISVIGCEAIEPGIPTYRGIPTCNIRNVPIEDAHLLEFHINHTGTIVPTGFLRANGSKPNLRLGTAKPIGHPDDPNAPRYTNPTSVGMGEVYQVSPFPPLPRTRPYVPSNVPR